MSLRERISDLKRSLQRALHITPMDRVLKDLRARGVPIGRMDALEPFAREGSWHTVDYAPWVASVTAWDINPDMEPALRRNLPNADRKITDSYREILKTNKKFDFIVVDTPVLPHGEYCEHFHFLQRVFRVARSPFVLVLAIVPDEKKRLRKAFPEFFGARHLAERKAFYGCRDPKHVSTDELVRAYKRCAREHGWEVEWWAKHPRDRIVDYFVMQLRRPRALASAAGLADASSPGR